MKIRIKRANTTSAYTPWQDFTYYIVQDYLAELRQHALWNEKKCKS